METIRGLCAFEGRLTGTDAERRAARWLAERLRDSGRAAEIEPTYVHPQYGLVHAAHCALGLKWTQPKAIHISIARRGHVAKVDTS